MYGSERVAGHEPLGLSRGKRACHWIALPRTALPMGPQSSEGKHGPKLGIHLFPDSLSLCTTVASFWILISENVAKGMNKSRFFLHSMLCPRNALRSCRIPRSPWIHRCATASSSCSAVGYLRLFSTSCWRGRYCCNLGAFSRVLLEQWLSNCPVPQSHLENFPQHFDSADRQDQCPTLYL